MDNSISAFFHLPIPVSPGRGHCARIPIPQSKMLSPVHSTDSQSGCPPPRRLPPRLFVCSTSSTSIQRVLTSESRLFGHPELEECGAATGVGGAKSKPGVSGRSFYLRKFSKRKGGYDVPRGRPKYPYALASRRRGRPGILQAHARPSPVLAPSASPPVAHPNIKIIRVRVRERDVRRSDFAKTRGVPVMKFDAEEVTVSVTGCGAKKRCFKSLYRRISVRGAGADVIERSGDRLGEGEKGDV
ncbi:hypothetical protein C8R45DRAFT_1174218 [Mycena sanguinolenta]|nr:hypothetical protein C8R45DRAFT_1174218 [Mycena sanguinolenta]